MHFADPRSQSHATGLGTHAGLWTAAVCSHVSVCAVNCKDPVAAIYHVLFTSTQPHRVPGACAGPIEPNIILKTTLATAELLPLWTGAGVQPSPLAHVGQAGIMTLSSSPDSDSLQPGTQGSASPVGQLQEAPRKLAVLGLPWDTRCVPRQQQQQLLAGTQLDAGALQDLQHAANTHMFVNFAELFQISLA